MAEDTLEAVLKRRPATAAGAVTDVDAAFLLETVRELRPDCVLEKGVASGVSSAVLLHALDGLTAEDDRARKLVSYDVASRCYYDEGLPVGYAVAEMLPQHKATFELVLGTDDFEAVKLRLTAGRRLFFIDAVHLHPFPTIDLISVATLLQPGDGVIFHDVNLVALRGPDCPNVGPQILFEKLRGDKKVVAHESANIGRWIFEGDWRGLWESLQAALAVKVPLPPQVQLVHHKSYGDDLAFLRMKAKAAAYRVR